MKIFKFLLFNSILILLVFSSCKKEEEQPNPDNLAIGKSWKGGVIAYILKPEDTGYEADSIHGLIATEEDLATAQWGCAGKLIYGADGSEIGTGKQNTKEIFDSCSTVGIAARICSNLDINGFNDWFLPSRDELRKLNDNKIAIGGFTDNEPYAYWSSTEKDKNYAWTYYISNGYSYEQATTKESVRKVRAIRAF